MLASGGVMKGGEKDGFFQRVLQALEVPFFFLKVFPRVFGHFPFWVLYADSTEMDQVHGCFKKTYPFLSRCHPVENVQLHMRLNED